MFGSVLKLYVNAEVVRVQVSIHEKHLRELSAKARDRLAVLGTPRLRRHMDKNIKPSKTEAQHGLINAFSGDVSITTLVIVITVLHKSVRHNSNLSLPYSLTPYTNCY